MEMHLDGKPLVSKVGYRLQLSGEALYDWLGYTDERFRRKVDRVIEAPPTEADWEEYREGVALLEKLRGNRFYYEGGPDEGSVIETPKARTEYVYAETHDEWLARCRAMQEADRG